MGRRKEVHDPVDVFTNFMHAIRSQSSHIFIGIDPGATGAIAFVSGKKYTVIDIPITKHEVVRTKKLSKRDAKKLGRKTERRYVQVSRFDLPRIALIFDILKTTGRSMSVVLEEIPASMGKGSHLSHLEIAVGRAFAMWPLFLISHNFDLHLVSPSQWKKHMGLTANDKEESRLLALKFFGKADIGLKSHHNRAEALLLAKYGKDKRGKSDNITDEN